jgi:MFS family permease
MFIDITLLKKNRNFRHLYLGQLVSYLGTLISVTVIPFQVYSLTQSSAMVGLVSIVELIPMLIAAFLGGALADHLDRKKLLIICEVLMSIGIAILMLNSSLAQPSLVVIFVVSALMQAVNGFHRPAMDSLGQALITRQEIPAAAALQTFKFGFVTLFGPSLGGILVSILGAQFAYGFDLVTFIFSVWMLSMLDTQHLLRKKEKLRLANSLMEGLRYAVQRQEILGTYLVDILAMTLAFPVALFPAISIAWGKPERVGLLYSALAVGSIGVPLVSGWASKVRKQGLVIIVSAMLWGLGIAIFGICQNFWIGLIFLFLAGIADTVSGLFRSMIWNQTIPNEIRGRMAGLEMISYMSGPLLGNARAGWVASITSNHISLLLGGVLCTACVLIATLFLPRFKDYVPKLES